MPTNLHAAPAEPARRVRPAVNASYLAGANLVAKALGFVLTLFIFRALSKSDYGNYNYIIGFVGLFEVVTDLGLTGLVVRDVARDPTLSSRYTSNVLTLRLLLSGSVVLLIIGLTQSIITDPHWQIAAHVYALSLLPLAVLNTLQAVFQFSERLVDNALFSVATTLVRVGLSLLVLALGYHALGLIVVFTVVTSISALATLLFVYARLLPRRFEVDLTFWPALLRRAVPFAMLTMLNVLYTRADTFILGILQHCGNSKVECVPVAQYGAATRVEDVLVMVFVGAVQAATLPVFTRVAVQSRSELVRLVRASGTLMLVLGVPVALFIAFFAPDALHVLAGKKYLDAAPALAVLVWTFPTILIVNIFYNALYALQRQAVVTFAFAVNLVFNAGLNVILIPYYSYMASSALTLASEILNGIIVLAALRHTAGPLGLGAATVKMTAVTLVTAALLWVLHPFGIFVGVPVGAVAILIGVRVTRLIGPTEREVLRTLPLIGRYANVL